MREVPNEGWGIAWAIQTGFAHATGEVVLRIDADVVPSRGHVSAHMRWHHAADYLVVLGSLKFAPRSALPAPHVLGQAVRDGREHLLFDECEGHTWWHKLVDEHDGLRTAPSPLMHRVHVGASVSQHHDLWTRAGGMDTSLVLAEDTDLGYRLTQVGAVFIPELEAPAWHLGQSTLMRRQTEVKRYNGPFVADRIPYRRFLRTEGGRQWLVPYVDVVIDTRGSSYEHVRGGVDAALVSTLPDVRVTLLGDWSTLGEGRRSPFDDPRLDERLIKGAYENDGRVRLVDDAGPTSAPAPFRLVCPPRLDGRRGDPRHPDREGRQDRSRPAAHRADRDPRGHRHRPARTHRRDRPRAPRHQGRRGVRRRRPRALRLRMARRRGTRVRPRRHHRQAAHRQPQHRGRPLAGPGDRPQDRRRPAGEAGPRPGTAGGRAGEEGRQGHRRLGALAGEGGELAGADGAVAAAGRAHGVQAGAAQGHGGCSADPALTA